MSKIRKPISSLLILLMLITQIPFSGKLNAKAEVSALQTYASVTGDMMSTNGLGDDWAPGNASGLMQTYSNGVYETTLNLKAGTYQYKIALNGTWDVSYGSASGDNISLAVPSEEKVTFRFDYKDKTVTDSVNNPDDFKSCATLTGSMQGWTPSDASYDLDYIGGGFYSKTFTLSAGSYEYKVAYNHGWDNGEVGSNVSLSLDADTSVTFLANPDLGICEDSVSHPEIVKSPSLIGTVRQSGDDDWNAAATGYELHYLADNGLYTYSEILPEGSYDYKVCNNYSWDGTDIPSGMNNVSLTIPAGGQYVTFICDELNSKVYDSVNNPDTVEEMLGVAVPAANGPVLNGNGTVTFSYLAPDASSVYLEGDMTSWDANKKLMTKDAFGNWSITLRLGDAAKSYAYQFVADGTAVTDPGNQTVNADGHSVYDFPGFSGRPISLPGTLQSSNGSDGNWNPAGTTNVFTYTGNGLYTLTLKDVPAGYYEYKIATNGSWDENYGADGISYGANLTLTVPETQDITFTYSDDCHIVVNSLTYHPADVKLSGSQVQTSGHTIAMTDANLSGIYSVTVDLAAGTYGDFTVVSDGKSIPVEEFTLDAGRKVTFSYDPVTQIAFNDASSKNINTNEIYFDSRDTQYKSVYGADTVNTPVTFNLKAGKDDLTEVKMVVIDNSDGGKITVVQMAKNGTFDSTHDKWSGTFTPSAIGLYKYYFVLTNGSQVKEYGDDDGYLGAGAAGDLGTEMNYDLNVCEADYTTPDWLKNAVIYQIFPDRFFDGDTSNDTAKKTARGATLFTFHDSWYAEPGNPAIGNDDGIYCNDIYGGDLQGIDQRLDYLQALGVTAIYLNPISDSTSNHRYDTSNYEEVDPFLGNLDNYVTLAQDLHSRGMHLIIDGVYNHVSDDSVYFDRYGKYVKAGQPLGAYQYWKSVYDMMNADADLSQADAESTVQANYTAQGITDFHYKDWFVISNTITPANDDDPIPHYQYEGWWGYSSMPVIQALNGSEENVTTWKEEILAGSDSNSEYWLNNGTDGLRMDVANEVSDDSWRTLRQDVKSVSSDDAIFGEIWTDASKYLLGDMFDSVMNYRFRDTLTSFVSGSDSSNEVTNQLELIREQYPKEAFEAMMNLVDSHDTARLLTVLNNDTQDVATEKSAESVQLMKLAALMQMTYPGAPMIYYGDELGMIGGADPDCRRAMDWGNGDQSLVEAYALYANIRDTYSVLRTGDIDPLDSGSSDVLSYVRTNDTDSALVILNRADAAADLSLNVSGEIADGTVLKDAANGTAYTVQNGKVSVHVGAIGGVVLVTDYQQVTIDEDALKPAFDSSYRIADRDYESQQEVSAQDLATVTDAKNSGAATLDATSNPSSDLLSIAIEQGVSPFLVSGSATLTLGDRNTAIYLNEHGISSVDFTASAPSADILKAISDSAKNGGANVLLALTFTTNLPEEALYGGTTLTLNVGSEYNGQTVYLYYYNTDTGLPEQTASAVVTDGNATFSITHLSTYFVTDAVLASNASTDTGSTGTKNTAAENPGTGSPVPPYAAVAFLFLLPAGALLLKKRAAVK